MSDVDNENFIMWYKDGKLTERPFCATTTCNPCKEIQLGGPETIIAASAWQKFLETYTMSNVTFEYFRPQGRPIKTVKKTKTIDEELADAY